MESKRHMLSTLLSSIAGILIFISTAFWLDIQGYTMYAPFLVITGVFLLFYPQSVLKRLRSQHWVSKHLLSTLGHIMIFIGTKILIFDKFIDNAWWLYLIVGIILLNKHKEIAHAVFRK